ncbi:NBR1-like protein [Triticum urartu]|uniref:NBR1-like protein n=1 Tax=Triticum urartu TaxID=4572 RepID=M7YM34_TRIUA|nr:NBR1-like protein [Triticum urartu]
MSALSAPPFDGLASGPDPWDVVVKVILLLVSSRGFVSPVKYGDTLKRFNGYVNGTHFTLNLSALRSKIASAFKFAPDADFILTYTDEDGDVVMLDDDEDLHDAAIHQKLNPLRINVQLKNSHAGASHINRQDSSPKPLEATTQDPIAQIKSVIDEALKPISEPLRSTAREDPLAHLKSALDEAMKSIHEPVPESLAKLSREVLDAAPPQLTDLIKPFVNLITSTNSSQSAGHAESSPGSSRGVQQARVDLKADGQPKVEASLGSRPLNERNPVSSETGGLKSVLVEVPAAVITEASQGHQGSLYPSVEDLLYTSNSGGNSSGCKDMTDAQTSDPGWRVPMYKAPHPSPPVPHAPLGYGHSPQFPYPGRLLSAGRLYENLGNNSERSPRISHRWIQCDGCGVQPIVGPRYKSNVKEDYDLCDTCFCRMGSEVEYTRIDKPILPHKLSRDPNLCRKIHSRAPMKSKREKLESRFILDVTVLDGTLMSPSSPFTKIWRMHNNGSIMWPLGTQLIWVGGDQFALQTSVPLEIPLNGFPVDQEMDVAVDFVAPARPGRYISYWRLASPSGQKFGQRVWVHIQVEDPSFVSDNKTAAVNLNQPQESNITNTSSLPQESNMTNTSNLIDVNMEPANQVLDEHVNGTRMELLEPLIYREAAEPKKSPSAFSAAPPYPMLDVPSSSENAAAFVPSVTVLAPEVIPRPAVTTPADVPTSSLTSIPVDLPVAATTPVDVASAPLDIDSLTEEKLLQELEEMGFKQVDLNKEILRQNKYNLEQSVDDLCGVDLCGVNEWDPLLAELNEMGFDDRETNKELLAKNGGSIKRAVMDLIAREKKDK